MNKLKPYTIGLLSSIFFHLPFFYFYFNITLFPVREVSILLDPLQIECTTTPPLDKVYVTHLKIPPMSLPPKEF